MSDIQESEIIWFPGVYHGRSDGSWVMPVAEVPFEEIVKLVQTRAEEDGEYCISHGMVGENNESEPKMRRMMAFVANEKFIRQCYDGIYKEGSEGERTVDFVCRDLANASTWAINAQDRKAAAKHN